MNASTKAYIVIVLTTYWYHQAPNSWRLSQIKYDEEFDKRAKSSTNYVGSKLRLFLNQNARRNGTLLLQYREPNGMSLEFGTDFAS